MKIFANSDVGQAREMNQDYYYASTENEKIKLYILADGMGGYKGGEIASKLAVEASKNYIKNNFDEIPKERESIQKLIKSAMEYANMVVYEKSKENEDLGDMGTTLDIALIYNNKVFIGHIGDSRVYRIRKHIIRKITTDHSYVEKLVKDGTITKEEALNHPKKNMLMKALGCSAYIEPDILVKGFLKDDILLMNSDGLTNMVSEEEIYNIIKEETKKSDIHLIMRANELGGYDNITVIIVENN